jgi:hypothetical protein
VKFVRRKEEICIEKRESNIDETGVDKRDGESHIEEIGIDERDRESHIKETGTGKEW